MSHIANQTGEVLQARGKPAAAAARPARIARRYGRHESLHLIAHRNPVYLPGEMDGQTVHSGLREHAGRVMHASHAVHRQVRCTVAGG